MKVTVVVNPNAGRQNILRELDTVRQVFEESGAEVEVQETADAEEAEAVLKKAAEEKPDVLVCCGGDGTLSQTVDSMLKKKSDVALGYIPAGSTNDFANSLALSKEPAEAARQIVRGGPRPLDTGWFGDRSFIYVACFGVFTKTSYSTDQAMKNALGHFAYILEGLKELSELKTYQLKAETDEGQTYEGNFMFGAVSNSTSFGGIVKLDSDRVDLCDGKLELLLIRTPTNLSEFNRIASSLVTGRYDEELIVFTHTTGVDFTCGEPMPWSLDGEYHPGGEQVRAEVLPQAIRLYY